MIRIDLPAWQKQGSRRILQGAHREVFPFDPRDPEGSGQAALLFDDRDLHGNAAVTRVLLEGRTEV